MQNGVTVTRNVRVCKSILHTNEKGGQVRALRKALERSNATTNRNDHPHMGTIFKDDVFSI